MTRLYVPFLAVSVVYFRFSDPSENARGEISR